MAVFDHIVFKFWYMVLKRRIWSVWKLRSRIDYFFNKTCLIYCIIFITVHKTLYWLSNRALLRRRQIIILQFCSFRFIRLSFFAGRTFAFRFRLCFGVTDCNFVHSGGQVYICSSCKHAIIIRLRLFKHWCWWSSDTRRIQSHVTINKGAESGQTSHCLIRSGIADRIASSLTIVGRFYDSLMLGKLFSTSATVWWFEAAAGTGAWKLPFSVYYSLITVSVTCKMFQKYCRVCNFAGINFVILLNTTSNQKISSSVKNFKQEFSWIFGS